MRKGLKVKFANPTEEERHLRFEVVEDRGERVLVMDLTGVEKMKIKPTCNYRKTELVEAND